MNDHQPVLVSSSRRRARQLRIIGVVVLVLGLGSAGTLYFLRTRAPELTDDPSMLGFNRSAQRQMGQLYGKSGQMIDEWTDDLAQPGAQAVLISVFSAAISAGCFYFARLHDFDHETG